MKVKEYILYYKVMLKSKVYMVYRRNIIMAKDDGAAIGILLGILGLVALAAILGKKRCKNCGFENLTENNVCSNCGFGLD